MKDYITFSNLLVDAVSDRSGSCYQVSKITVLKNNGIELDAINITVKGENISPNIYIESYYDQYCEGASIDELAEDIIMCYKHAILERPKNTADMLEFKMQKQHIFYKLVNAEKNKEFLSKVPHKQCLDLAMTYHCLVENNEAGIKSFCITNSLMSGWGIDEDTLYHCAIKNTETLFPLHLEEMETMVTRMLCGGDMFAKDNTDNNSLRKEELELTEHSLAILTNTCNINGAGVIFYPNVLHSLASKIQSDLYVLPSSIHECILLPVGEYKKEQLLEMVREVNQTQVKEEEVLSNEVYRYVLEQQELLIAE